MSKRGRKSKEQIRREKGIDINKVYDLDEFVGESWKAIFDEILNKRYADGWEYVPPYFYLGQSNEEYDKVHQQPAKIYGVLYKRKLHLPMNISSSSSSTSSSMKNKFSME